MVRSLGDVPSQSLQAPHAPVPWNRAMLTWGVSSTVIGSLLTWGAAQFALAPDDGTDAAGMAAMSFGMMGIPALVAGVTLVGYAVWRRFRAPRRPRAPGWQHDPWSEAPLRYWDGQMWTESSLID